MKDKFHSLIVIFILFCSLVNYKSGYAQLDQTFQNIFNFFLRDQIQLSGEFHGEHFFPAANQADSLLTPALNSLVAGNVSSFPLSSTVAGVTYDFSTGRPVSITESLGPIFAETAETLGSRRLNIGFNYTYLNLVKFRGLSTNDIRFTFTHEDNSPTPPFGPEDPENPSLGNPAYENDNMDLFLDLDVNAQIFALFATVGVTNKLDLGVAIPFVNISLSGNARAVINSFTYGRSSGPSQFQGAAHRFGGTLLNPVLEDNRPYDESATGIGDIAVRLKYSFLRGSNIDLAALADVRLPTGKEEDFLGTGNATARFFWIMSKNLGEFRPHLNIGYDRRWAKFDSDELEFIAGFDQKIGLSGLTLAAEIMGVYDLQESETIQLFPGSVTITDEFANDLGSGSAERKIDLSNIPERNNDNTLDLALGFRYAPSEKLLFLANILTPLDDGGLRSSFAPTVGLTVNF